MSDEVRKRPGPLAAVLLALALVFSSCVAPSGWVEYSPQGGDTSTATADGSRGAETGDEAESSAPEYDAASWFAERVDEADKHAVLVETLDSAKLVAAYNADKSFNPASLIKLATSLAALRKLGPGYRFKVQVYASGEVNQEGTLGGDLYFMGGAPTFGDVGANMVAEELRKRGVKRIGGSVNVSHDFCFNMSDSAQTSADRLAKSLRLEKSPGTKIVGAPEGKLIFTFYSHPLREILLYMNAHSSNFVAHRVGERVGGPKGIEKFLEEELKIAPEEVNLSTTSGLERNEMTARGVVKVLRALVSELDRHGLKPVDVLPVANTDTGTLRKRLEGTGLAGALLGKTGTLTSTDGGMASLAGLVYVQEGEPLVFAILDQGTRLSEYRDLQEKFLLDLLAARANPQPVGPGGRRDLLLSSSMRIEHQGNLDQTQPEAPAEATVAE